MRSFLKIWVVNIACLWAITSVFPGIKARDFETLLLGAFFLGVIHVSIKPAIRMLTLPLQILSLGLVTLFINGSIFFLVLKLVKGFFVQSYWDAFWASILFGAASSFIHIFTGSGLNIRAGVLRSRDHHSPKNKKIIDTQARKIPDA